MTTPVRSLVAMPRVRSVPESIAFYRRLGFEVKNTFVPEGHTEPTWAYMTAGKAQLMVAESDETVVPSQQGVLFYAYCDDVPALREELLSAGVAAGPIETPFYAPKGEFRVQDPDGYVIMVTHT
jgi:catechol 2,3-dioxygenase-like lactoylglutathione lyase family enzyme